MKTIKLNNGQDIKVDDVLYDKLSQHHWYLINGYPSTRIGDKQVYMHLMVLALDNRLHNLRITTNQLNCMNRGLNKNNTSGYKGVSWNKLRMNWLAGIYYNYKRIYLGSYTNIKDAARAYNEKAEELYGEFAWLNTID